MHTKGLAEYEVILVAITTFCIESTKQFDVKFHFEKLSFSGIQLKGLFPDNLTKTCFQILQTLQNIGG